MNNENFRSEIKQLADDVRFQWSRKGVTDVFDVLDQIAILIRSPYQTSGRNKMFDGFSTYINKHLVVYINSGYTLGRERFSAAHELYHLTYDKEVLMSKKVLDDDEENEKRADTFAVEFLMPEEGVRDYYHNEIFYKLQPKHIVRLQHRFQVSYRAMLKRLRDLGLCSQPEFEELEKFGFIDYADYLKELTIKEGFSLALITPSNIISIPHRYIEMFKDNYESGNISYSKYSSLLKLINKTPQDYGFQVPKSEEI